jgi:uncharacterized protein (DUF486 family)
MPVVVQTVVLLVCSNVFMTFAWYAHLRDLRGQPHRLRHPRTRPAESDAGGDHPGGVVPFAVFYMRQPLKLDFLWAGLCLLGAVNFTFRG